MPINVILAVLALAAHIVVSIVHAASRLADGS